MPKSAILKKADAAMRQAVAEVMEEHRKSGRPVALWKDGKVKWVKLSRKNGAKKSHGG